MTQNTNFKFSKESVVEFIKIRPFSSSEYLDITALVEQFNIYEDILSPFLSADFTLIDGLTLRTSLPLVGQEIIIVQFKSSFTNITQTIEFQTYRVGPVSETTNTIGQMYTIYAASPEFVQNKRVRVSKSFSDRHDSIVSQIYENYLKMQSPQTYPKGKPLNIVDVCNDFETLIVPSWNPVRAINWIASRSRSQQNIKECAFVFFEQMGNGFVYSTLQSLCSQTPKFAYGRILSNFATVEGLKDTILPILTIDQYQIDDDFNSIESMNEGRYRSSLNYYDPVTRTYDSKTYNIDEEFGMVRHTEKSLPVPQSYSLSSASPVSNIGFFPQTNERITGEKDSTMDVYLRSNAQFSQFRSHTVKISVPGNSDLHCGDTCSLMIPSKKAARDGQKPVEQYDSGKFLVRSVRHNIVQNQTYTSFVVLVRDSVPVNYPVVSVIKPENTGGVESKSDIFDFSYLNT